jgi:hypothetical protein
MSGRKRINRHPFGSARRPPGGTGVSGTGIGAENPVHYVLRCRLADALDPARQPGPVRTLKDMTPEERADLERRYGAKVGR